MALFLGRLLDLCQILTPGVALKLWYAWIFPAEKKACYYFSILYIETSHFESVLTYSGALNLDLADASNICKPLLPCFLFYYTAGSKVVSYRKQASTSEGTDSHLRAQQKLTCSCTICQGDKSYPAQEESLYLRWSQLLPTERTERPTYWLD